MCNVHVCNMISAECMIDLTVLLRSFKLSDSKDSIPMNTTTEYPDLSRTGYVPYVGGQVRTDMFVNNA